jgi:hypothetical protein
MGPSINVDQQSKPFFEKNLKMIMALSESPTGNFVGRFYSHTDMITLCKSGMRMVEEKKI